MLREPPQDAPCPPMSEKGSDPLKTGSQTPFPTPADKGADPLANRDKVRIRFKKAGDLRLVSHHDLMHCFERMFRRAALPFHSSEGFNPKPRMAFALSLALGIVGAEEVLELELDEHLPAQEIHERLARQTPPGLEILSVKRIPRKTKAQVRRVCYSIPVSSERAAELPARCAALLTRTECWVERSRPQPRRLDVRPYLRGLRMLDGSGAQNGEPITILEMDLWVTPYGTVRPEEVLGLLEIRDLLDAGAVLERTKLALHDEDQTPDSGPESRGPGTVDRGPGNAARSTDHAPRSTPLVPGPLSFDS
jgi:radical SAM-linked protein